MKRYVYQKLIDWKSKKDRKPLLLKGARQVGKTWLMKEFGGNEFEHQVYINFESSRNLHQIFEQDLSVARIVRALEIETGKSIDPETTLIVFDEIQACPRAITSLKYFNEEAPEFAIIAGGSLLGVAMHPGESFPVGKVEFIEVFPMNFYEFLHASNQEKLVQLLISHDWEMIRTFKTKYIDLLKEYYYVGGMPEVVANFIENKDYRAVREIQHRILDAYEQDFSKHAPHGIVPRIRLVWQNIIAQLSKENKKFIYGSIRSGSRAKDFELAINWLIDAGLVYKVTRIDKPNIPLAAYEDMQDFKLYLHDMGLLNCMGDISIKILNEGNSLFNEFKGSLTEQYVLQQFKSIGRKPYYWKTNKSEAEVDLVIQQSENIIPIEVKSEQNLKSKSLKIYFEKYRPTNCKRLSMGDYINQGWVTNVPLYAALEIGNI